MNGGTCVPRNQAGGKRFICQCTSHYMGERCEKCETGYMGPTCHDPILSCHDYKDENHGPGVYTILVNYAPIQVYCHFDM